MYLEFPPILFGQTGPLQNFAGAARPESEGLGAVARLGAGGATGTA